MTKAIPVHPFNNFSPYSDDISGNSVNKSMTNNEQRLRILLEIVEYKTDNLQQLLEFTLEKVIEITQSKIGYIYYYDENRQLFTLNSWSKNVMKECEVVEPQTEYQLDRTGLWGEVVRQKKPILVNDFDAENSLKKGYPEGHVHLKKFLAIPVFHEDKIVANVGVANKETDYTEDDILQLKLLMDAVWKRIIGRRVSKILEQEKEKAQLYLDIVPIIILTLDVEGKVKMINEEGLKILKTSADNVIGRDWIESFVPEEEREKVSKVLESLKQGHEDQNVLNKIENDILDTEGVRHQTIWKSRVIRDESGKVVEIIASGQDVTESKEIISSLAQAEGKFQKYIEVSPQGIFVVNPKGEFLMVNPMACELLDYTAQELLQMNMTDIVLEERKERIAIEFAAIREKGRLKNKFVFRKKGNIHITLLVNAVLLPSGEFLSFCDDVTEEDRIANQLREQNEQLTRMNKVMIDRELKMVELKEQLRKSNV